MFVFNLFPVCLFVCCCFFGGCLSNLLKAPHLPFLSKMDENSSELTSKSNSSWFFVCFVFFQHENPNNSSPVGPALLHASEKPNAADLLNDLNSLSEKVIKMRRKKKTHDSAPRQASSRMYSCTVVTAAALQASRRSLPEKPSVMAASSS